MDTDNNYSSNSNRLTSSFFWTDETSNAVFLYQLESDYSKRNEVYNTYLFHPIRKLCEWVAFRMNNLGYVRSNINEAIKEAQSHITIHLKDVKQNKGNPFSYLVRVCMNYLTHFNMVHSKYYLNTESLDEIIVDKVMDEREIADDEYRKCIIEFWMRNARRQFPRTKEPEKHLIEILSNSKTVNREQRKRIKLFNRVLREHYLKHGNLDDCDSLLIGKKAKSPLTQNDVMQIRELYQKGNINQTQLAKQYKVTARTICDIVNNKSWQL
jgi:hypothetical protein